MTKILHKRIKYPLIDLNEKFKLVIPKHFHSHKFTESKLHQNNQFLIIKAIKPVCK